MTVHIEIRQERTLEEGPLYRVRTFVVYISGINRNIFVYNTETQEFAHVATTWDMQNLPDNRNDALLNNIDYYRADESVKEFSNAKTAEEFAAYTVARVQYLMSQYAIMSESFIGTYDYTFEE